MKKEIINSWEKNASEWIKTVQSNAIPSRKFTNPAILETLKTLEGQKIVDVGCGEGWLTREMGKMGWEATGIDAIETLIQEAKNKGPEAYHVLTFEAIVAGTPIPNGPFDAAIFNFCLYLKEDLVPLLENTLKHISEKGSIIIQTLHPYFLIQNELAYQSQWLSDSWKGLPGNFEDGHSWYARTLEDWVSELNCIEGIQFSLKEIVNNEKKPVSLLIKITKL